MKSKNVMLWALFLKKRSWIFFLYLSNHLNFSVVVRMYKIHVFVGAFLLLATVAMITQNVTFFSFHSNHFKGAESLHHYHTVYQSKLSLNQNK